MTSNEVIFSAVVCISLGIVCGLILVLADLGEGGVFAVVAIGSSLSGVVAGQMTVRVDRRKRGRLHQPR
jgi:DMSO reductase anchor subunit